MDQFTRRIVGVGVHAGAVTGLDLCRLFNAALHGHGVPRRLSTDHDPLFEAPRWQVNLRILDSDELKTVPYVPGSHRSSSSSSGRSGENFSTMSRSGMPVTWNGS
jgi:hypothetical protein